MQNMQGMQEQGLQGKESQAQMREPSGRDGGGSSPQLSMDHSQMDPGSRSAVTQPQLAAMTGLSLLLLGAGVLLAALFGNFTMRNGGAGAGGSMPGMGMGGAVTPGSGMPGSNSQPPAIASLQATQMMSVTQMNGMVMPPGMIMMSSMSMDAMRGMAAVDLNKVGYTAPPDSRGDQALTPQIVAGVKVFTLEVSLINWYILPNREVAAYAFNHQVPGPRITLTEGDRVRFLVKNDLPEPTSVHWHGLILPNQMDGAAGVTQPPIAPGSTFTYEFTAAQQGTFFYHSHQEPDRQQALGLYGALIINPRTASSPPAYNEDVVVQLQEWTVQQGYTFPAMPMEGLLPNFFTINGKSYPATETINAKVGDRVRLRFIGSNSAFIHPMHIHGGPFTIIATDGNPVPATAQIQKDTVDVGPGERYDVVWPARSPGKWLLHCHINHHITNDGVEEQGGGGLTMILNVTP